ncbi:hypothetical protein CSB95_2894 [Pseudomonas aeruginosa]|nr:hypothetical protein CSC29_2887 [Pseudomonas aeruginosa]PRW08792.1 hypothetical protein CSB95_2894 [Pseudomonas aeruginosa]
MRSAEVLFSARRAEELLVVGSASSLPKSFYEIRIVEF